MIKKIGIAIGCMLMAQQIYAQQNDVFVIEGNIKGVDQEMAYIVRFRDAKQAVTDSALVRSGKFKIKGKCEGAELVFIKFGKRIGKYFFLENAKIRLSGASENIRNLQVKGSKSDLVYDQVLALQEKQRKLDDAETAKFKAVYDVDKVKAEVLREELQVFRATQLKEMVDFLSSHAESGAAQFFFLQYYLPTQSVPAIEAFIKRAGSVKTAYKTELDTKLLFLKGLQPGAESPLFELPDVNGKMLSLADYRGRYVLVDFWASWCAPCRMENPNVVKAYNKYKEKGFTVLGVSLDDNKDKWVEAIEKDGLTWTHISDLKGWKSPPVAQYNVTGVPFSVLVDPSGKIVGTDLKGQELQSTLERIFSKK